MVDNRLTVLDERGNWHGPMTAAARKRGYVTHTIKNGEQASGGGLGFIRPHAVPSVLRKNQHDYLVMQSRCAMVQDAGQVETYDNKSEQFRRWGHWMPPTWRFENRDQALAFLEEAPERLVSKADVGASSKNVRLLFSRAAQISHVNEIFDYGIEVDHCAGGGPTGREAKSVQRGYVLLQEFVPQDCTWRVNIVGRAYAMFQRFNYPDTPIAQTGNVRPVKSLDDRTVVEVLEFAKRIFPAIGTKWCALDIVYSLTENRPYLLETSLGWPWPSPGDCDNAPFFETVVRPHTWKGMWDLMLDEYEDGVWTAAPTAPSTTLA